MSKNGPSQPSRKPLNPKFKGKKSEGEKKASLDDQIEAELAKDAEARALAEAEAAGESAPTSGKKPVVKGKPDQAKAQLVSVNERQIASDTLSLSGDRMSDFLARISDVLQANGKIIVSLVVVAVFAAIGLWVFESRSAAERGSYAAEVAAAKTVDSTLTGRKKAAAIAENFGKILPGEESWKQAEYWYQYADAYFSALISARSQEADKITPEEIQKDNEAIKEKFMNYFEVIKKDPEADPAAKDRKALFDANILQLDRDQEFRTSKDSRFSEHSEFWLQEAGKELTKLVQIEENVTTMAEGNPEIVFDTARGLVRIRLYELTRDIIESDPNLRAEQVRGERKLLQNAIGVIMQAVKRGYYDRQTIDGVNVPGVAAFSDPVLNQANFTEFGRRGMLPRKAKKDETAKEAEDKPAKEAREPDFAVLPERVSSLRATQGSVFQMRDLSSSVISGTRLGVNLGPDNKDDFANLGISSNFQVIGEIVDGLDVVRQLRRGDVIYKAWVSRERKDTMRETGYLPRVLFLDDSKKNKANNQIPELWTDEKPAVNTPRIEKVETPAKITKKGDSWERIGEFNSNNPIVAIKTPKGDVLIELFEDSAPNSVQNFIYLVQNKLDFLKESVFSPNADDKTLLGGVALGEPIGWTIGSESREAGYNLRNLQGTVAMHYSDGPDGASTQFAINMDDNTSRDGNKDARDEKGKAGYTVFGRVIKNFWALSEIKLNDRIEDAWVVQLRDGVSYDPMVTATGDAGTVKASEVKAKAAE